MLKTKVKISNVTNLSEARYCAGMGVDYLSFPAGAVDPEKYQEITGWVAGPQFGISINDSNFSWNKYTVDFIETSLKDFFNQTDNTKYIIRLTPEEWTKQKENLLLRKDRITALDFNVSQLDTHSETILRESASHFEVLVTKTDSILLNHLLALPIAGINLAGNPESKPGLKEYPLAEILEQLEVE